MKRKVIQNKIKNIVNNPLFFDSVKYCKAWDKVIEYVEKKYIEDLCWDTYSEIMIDYNSYAQDCANNIIKDIEKIKAGAYEDNMAEEPLEIYDYIMQSLGINDYQNSYESDSASKSRSLYIEHMIYLDLYNKLINNYFSCEGDNK